MLFRPLIIAVAMSVIAAGARPHAAAQSEADEQLSIANQTVLATTPADRSLLHSVELLRLSLGLATHCSPPIPAVSPQLALASHARALRSSRGEAMLCGTLQALCIRLQI